MATKDWKKVPERYYSPGVQYVWKKRGWREQIGISSIAGYWYVNIDTQNFIDLPQQFNTKIQALNFAKQYMRTH